MKDIKAIKEFVERFDKLGGELGEYKFGDAFGLELGDEEMLGSPIDSAMATIREKTLNGKIGYIGTAIIILEEVLGIKKYTPTLLFRLSVALLHLSHISQEKLVKDTFKDGQKVKMG
jgi:hypothetical protein